MHQRVSTPYSLFPPLRLQHVSYDGHPTNSDQADRPTCLAYHPPSSLNPPSSCPFVSAFFSPSLPLALVPPVRRHPSSTRLLTEISKQPTSARRARRRRRRLPPAAGLTLSAARPILPLSLQRLPSRPLTSRMLPRVRRPPPPPPIQSRPFTLLPQRLGPPPDRLLPQRRPLPASFWLHPPPPLPSVPQLTSLPSTPPPPIPPLLRRRPRRPRLLLLLLPLLLPRRRVPRRGRRSPRVDNSRANRTLLSSPSPASRPIPLVLSQQPPRLSPTSLVPTRLARTRPSLMMALLATALSKAQVGGGHYPLSLR